MKYCLLTTLKLDALEKEHPIRSGLYKWLDVFNGECKLYRERESLEQYDVVHINASGGDVGIIQPVVESLRNSSTQVVVGNDYSIEMWQAKMPYNPHVLTRSLKGACWYFSTEPKSSNLLKALVPDSRVYTFPHPVDVKLLNNHRPKGRVEDRISITYHRYDNQLLVPWTVTRDHPWSVWLVGYLGSRHDPQNWWTVSLFDGIKPGRVWLEHINMLSTSGIVYEPTTFNTWSRTGAELASLGLPAFGSDRGESMRRCYPKTCCDPMDVHCLRKHLADLGRESYRSEVAEYAKNQSGYYDLELAKARFMACVEENRR